MLTFQSDSIIVDTFVVVGSTSNMHLLVRPYHLEFGWHFLLPILKFFSFFFLAYLFFDFDQSSCTIELSPVEKAKNQYFVIMELFEQ